ncbi:GNAT family N-acetyltransferase [Hymenobacter bucti]|uniref:GNAT family N-acetyltransferase n=1 Tax=Hymenobacter bucti TaxID=1844114 RepID=A0ABW4QPA2_9BACT
MLDTNRLQLRPYQATDADAFFRVLDQSRARLQHSFPDRLRAVPTLADAPTQLAAFARDWRTGRFYVFGIWHRANQAYLGDICLMPQRGGQAEIGYYLALEAEGHGYAREALGAIVQFGFEQVQAERLLIRCFADNKRAQQVAQAHGFQLLAQEEPTRPWFHFSFWDNTPPQAPAILHFIRPKSQIKLI